MRYINKKTRAIVDSPSVIRGKDWEMLEQKEPVLQTEEINVEEVPVTEEETTADVAEEEFVEEEINLEEMSKKELIEFAKEQKIEINERDNKPTIIGTIAKAFE